MALQRFPDLMNTIEYNNERTRDYDLHHCEEGASEVYEISGNKLYLGNKEDSEQYNRLNDMNIKTVISLLNDHRDISVRSNYLILDITHHHYEIQDNPYSNLACILDEIVTNIIEGLKHGSVLIHCHAGISRSASCVLYFLLQINRFNLLFDAYEYLVRCRSIISPNMGFLIQLYLQYRSPEDRSIKDLLDMFFNEAQLESGSIIKV